ncbi:MAG: type II toxin-antitoxin system HicB family antitoxin [Candidatus Methylomirabilota bacterium]|jgi:predicted RNase H-like HicB family nuclease
MTTTDRAIKKVTPDDYLKSPYARILMPETDGTYAAEILEFPGCFAQGQTPAEAYSNLEEAARGWIAAALEHEQEIPKPTVNQVRSGRLALRLPRSLHHQASRLAERDGTSLNQFVVTSVASRVGAEEFAETLAQRWSELYVKRFQAPQVNTCVYVTSLQFNQSNQFVTSQDLRSVTALVSMLPASGLMLGLGQGLDEGARNFVNA